MIEYYQAIVDIDPYSAVLHHNLGNVFCELKKYNEAKIEYLKALNLDPNLIASYTHLGLTLQEELLYIEALPWLKKGIELEPDNIDNWIWLAKLYDEMEESFNSIIYWKKVIELNDSNEAYISLGQAYQENGEYDLAKQCYIKSSSYLNLGILAEEMGDLVLAEKYYRQSVKPSYARLATLLKAKLSSDDQETIKKLLKTNLNDDYRARLLFGLAHVFDAQDNYESVIQCLNEANALTIKKYNPIEHEQFINKIINHDLSKFRDSGLETKKPIFIFGLPRSGTSLIEQILSSHSMIHGAGELRLAQQFFKSKDTILNIAQKYFNELDKLSDKLYIIDKMPGNYMYISFLSLIFPNAIFIHCKRDLRDVALSCWMTDFRSIRWANNQDYIIHRFQQYRCIMEHWKKILPITIHEVNYEEVVINLESEAKRLINNCNLKWESTCLEFYLNKRSVRTASLVQVRQPIYKNSLNKWENYKELLGDFFSKVI